MVALRRRFLATLERNRLVHEHMTEPEKFTQDVRAAGQFVSMFGRTYQHMLHIAKDKFQVSVTNHHVHHG